MMEKPENKKFSVEITNVLLCHVTIKLIAVLNSKCIFSGYTFEGVNKTNYWSMFYKKTLL